MALANLTSRPAFLLLGLTDGTDVHPLLFLLFLGVYLVNALGNLSMVVLTAIFSEGLAVVLTPLLLVDLSYARILVAVLGVRSAGGRRRVFSTCGAHLVAVSLFFGSILSVYFRPSSAYSARYDRLASVVYAVVTPTLNPFIYSLHNKEVKGALKRGLRWRTAPPRCVRAGVDSLPSQE
ncbi:hypothetical protein Celaphus_00000857 [Cervus elaphus hippelaphus]|uniref:G-protein coupled receptors family 1 profile domain-containing protein n=1 Tax=Cervus elaphus hippelaphus TaxID=46360 RepID=A0A212DA23_CEREH|nr:hypothetical protein Celaphus_00000857 [Cervus elaphus hippelaphus]